MKSTPILSKPYILIFLLLIACNTGEGPQKESKTILPGSPLAYLEEIKQSKDPREIINLANAGLTAVTSRKDTVIHNLLDTKIYYHDRLKEYDSALLFADSLISSAKFQKDTFFIATGHYRKSRIFNDLQENEPVYFHAFQARKYYQALGDSIQAGRRSLEMAMAQRRLGDLSGSQETATEALRLLKPQKDSSYIGHIHRLLGLVYEQQGFYEQAIPEHELALVFHHRQIDKLADRNNLAAVQMGIGNYDTAIEIWEDLIAEVDPENKSSLGLYKANLAYVKWLKDPEADLEAEFLEALKIKIEAGDKDKIRGSYKHLMDYHRDRNPEKAREYAEKYLKAARDLENAPLEQIALQEIIELTPSGNVRPYTLRYMHLNDSLNQEMLRAKNAFAKIRFDEEYKQQQILGLEAEKARQELETQRWRTRNYIALLLGMLILLGIIFFIYFLRQKYRREKVREVHRTESRISKRIHDELANDVYNVMSSLEAVAPAEAVDRLEYIYRRTRDISRENSEIVTGNDFSAGLLSMLSSTTGKARLIMKGESAVNWNRISEEKKIVIYRVLQELMINMKKHSRAQLVALSFSENTKHLEIRYSDTGKGASPTILKSGGGIHNMRTRLSSVNGDIVFKIEEDKGFKAEIHIPY